MVSMIIRIVVALILFFAIAGMMAAGPGSRFNGEYAPGATVNAIDGLIVVVRSGLLAVICAIGLATNEIVAAIGRMREAQEAMGLRDRTVRRPASVVPAQAAGGVREAGGGDHVEAQPQPLGKRKGETDEQWAARMEAAEIAAFKARNPR